MEGSGVSSWEIYITDVTYDSCFSPLQKEPIEVAWKYTNNQEDAKDLSQEVLIKIITKLSTFKGNSSFRTGEYRIVVNQFLQKKTKLDFTAFLVGIVWVLSRE